MKSFDIFSLVVLILPTMFVFYIITILYVIGKIKRLSYLRTYTPAISIVIPAYNEERSIVKTLKSILRSRYPMNFMEVIVVDDKSTDSTYTKAIGFKHNFKNLKVVQSGHVGKANALNVGISKASNKIVLLLDADITYLDPEFIINIVKPLQKEDIAYVVSPTLFDQGRSIYNNFLNLEIRFISFIRSIFTRSTGFPLWFGGSGVALKKEILVSLGYFDNDILVEDADLSIKAYLAGYKAYWTESAIHVTAPKKNIKDFIKQRLRWSYGSMQIVAKYFTTGFREPIIFFMIYMQVLWIIGSFIVPLSTLSVLFKSLVSGYESFSSFILSLTIPGYFFDLLTMGPTNLNILKLFIAYIFGVSLFKYNRLINSRAIFSYVFYPYYVLFLHICSIASLIKYRMKLNYGFIAD